MDEPTIVVTIKDRFDHERSDPYGSNIKAIVTSKGAFVTMFADASNQFASFSLNTSLSVDNLVHAVLRHFILNANRFGDPTLFTKIGIDKALENGLTFIVGGSEPTFFRYKGPLTSGMVEADQDILVSVAAKDTAFIIRVDALIVGTAAGSASFKSMKLVYEHFNASSLISLLKATAMQIYLIGHNAQERPVKLIIKRQGISGTWTYDGSSCSIALMEQV